MLRLCFAALLLTFVVVVFGAYVRLSDAGLGCPDWPGCYGHPTPELARGHIEAAERIQPGGPVSLPKAWKEMIHRYLAAGLGLLIVLIALQALRRARGELGARGVALSLALVALVCVQGLLGRWTVTLLLKPAIVTSHLLGGMAILAVLTWLCLQHRGVVSRGVSAGVLCTARLGVAALALQIALGGWVSTNYAALACSDLPTCHGQWLPAADFVQGFHIVRELGMSADGALLSQAALTAIHWTHRLGALLVGSYLSVLALLLWRSGLTWAAVGLSAALALQIGIGFANVAFSLPLPLAVAHNAGAALLLVVLVTVNYLLRADSPRVWTRGGLDEGSRPSLVA